MTTRTGTSIDTEGTSAMPTRTEHTEIIFEVREDDTDGGYSASAIGYGIHTQGDDWREIRRNVREAVNCYFDETMVKPSIIRLHFVRQEVLVA